MIKPGRIPCSVVGCRRTAPVEKYGEDAEIICGKCWRLVSRAAKRAFRRWGKFVEAWPHLSKRPRHKLRVGIEEYAWRRYLLAWSRVVSEAVEARAGLR